MTVGQFMQIYNAQIAAVQAQLAPKDLNDLSVRNIQLSKTAADLYPHDYPVQHSVHMNIGIQRELPGNMMVGGRFRPAQLRGHAHRRAGSEPLQPLHQRRADARHSTMHERRPAQRPERPVLEWRHHVLDARRPRAIQRSAGQARQALLAPLPVRRVLRVHRPHVITIGIDPNLDNYFESYGPTGARHLLTVRR